MGHTAYVSKTAKAEQQWLLNEFLYVSDARAHSLIHANANVSFPASGCWCELVGVQLGAKLLRHNHFDVNDVYRTAASPL